MINHDNQGWLMADNSEYPQQSYQEQQLASGPPHRPFLCLRVLRVLYPGSTHSILQHFLLADLVQ